MDNEDVGFILFIVIVVLFFGTIVTLGLLSANTTEIRPVENDCLSVVYEDNRVFQTDTDYSGLYCEVKP